MKGIETTLLIGASGRWQITGPRGERLAGGKIPRRAVSVSPDRERIILSQIREYLSGSRAYEWPGLRGGHLIKIEVPQEWWQALLEKHRKRLEGEQARKLKWACEKAAPLIQAGWKVKGVEKGLHSPYIVMEVRGAEVWVQSTGLGYVIYEPGGLKRLGDIKDRRFPEQIQAVAAAIEREGA